MKTFSTTQAAKKLGIDPMTLSRYIRANKVPVPAVFRVGRSSLHAWTEKEIESVRKLLPKIANGRKTRYQKKESAIGTGPAVKGKAKKQKTKKKSRP